MAQTYALSGLGPREAVMDAIHRCALGIDTNDRDLFESSLVKNDDLTVIAGEFKLQGWDAVDKMFVRVFEVITTHVITNIRVQLKDEDTACMTAHAISYHNRPEDAFKPEDTSYTAGSLYFMDLIKDETDGLWKMTRWELKILWTTGDKGVLHA
jgi:hypothetical protein